MANSEDRHQGQFLGAHVHEAHIKKLELVESKFDEMLGTSGRNKANALRYIIDCFDLANLEHFPKSRASVKEIP